MKILILISATFISTAFAGITCDGAQKFALSDAEVMTSAINQLPLTEATAEDFLNREEGNLGNIAQACEKDFEGKEEFCLKMAALNEERKNGINWNIKGTESQKKKLRTLNSKLLATLKNICK